MNNKVVYDTPASVKKTNRKNTGLAEWNYVCTFGSCLVYANGDRRRLINTVTGEIVFEYTIGIHDAGLNTNMNKDRNKKR
jgi:hypothetical protein